MPRVRAVEERSVSWEDHLRHRVLTFPVANTIVSSA